MTHYFGPINRKLCNGKCWSNAAMLNTVINCCMKASYVNHQLWVTLSDALNGKDKLYLFNKHCQKSLLSS